MTRSAFLATAVALVALGAAATSASADHRNFCEAITGTQYQHPGERQWFWANCVLDIYGGGVPTHAHPAPPQTVQDPAAAFARGYADAGGPAAYLDRILDRVIPCESTWDRYAVNAAGPFYGLAQFWPPTWQTVGGGDYFDAYTQGRNTARLILTSNPATQWPHCWWA